MGKRDRNIYEAFGNLFFVTSTVVGFLEVFRHEALCDIMIDNLKFYQDRGDFIILAYVIMPNHFHLIIKVNEGHTISSCIGNLKRITSRQITEKLQISGNDKLLTDLDKEAGKEPTNDSKIWKNRFDSFVLSNEDTLRQKIDYIHGNPARKGLIGDVTRWKYSSASDYYGTGLGILAVDKEWKCLRY